MLSCFFPPFLPSSPPSLLSPPFLRRRPCCVSIHLADSPRCPAARQLCRRGAIYRATLVCCDTVSLSLLWGHEAVIHVLSVMTPRKNVPRAGSVACQAVKTVTQTIPPSSCHARSPALLSSRHPFPGPIYMVKGEETSHPESMLAVSLAPRHRWTAVKYFGVCASGVRHHSSC